MTDAQNQQPIDPAHRLAIPDTSPAISVLRMMTADKERFEIEHKPMSCPEIPEAPHRVRAGKRAHAIATLRDLQKYVNHAVALPDDESERQERLGRVVAFYTPDHVVVVLDDAAEHERETIRCTLQRHSEFEQWDAWLDDAQGHAEFVGFLREHTTAIDRVQPGAAQTLIGEFSALAGTLKHDTDEFLERQAKGASFVVSKRRGGKDVEHEVEDVPTDFMIELPVLADDTNDEDAFEYVRFRVMVRMTPSIGGGIQFQPIIENFGEKVNEHIDKRLADFAEKAGFLCVRGEYHESDWREPKLPESVVALMSKQTEMIQAMARARS